MGFNNRDGVIPSKVSGILVVICGPSGVGKTSLVRKLVELTGWELSVSYTTRPPRHGETGGMNYHFIDVAQFESMRTQGEFLEHARVFDHHYGTSAKWVQERFAQGANIILEVDWQGAMQARQRIPNCYSIMIVPPSVAELNRRLTGRKQDPPEVIDRRMRDAVAELSHYRNFDFLVVNEIFTEALRELEVILQCVALTTRSRLEFLQVHLPEVLRAAQGNERYQLNGDEAWLE